MSRRQSLRPSISKRDATQWVVEYAMTHPQEELNYRLLARFFQVKDRGVQRLFDMVMGELSDQGYLRRVAHGCYMLANPPLEALGAFTSFPKERKAYVTLEDGTLVQVDPRGGVHVLEGDTVRVVYHKARRGNGLVGRVVEIVKRAREYYVGTLYIQGRYGFVVPTSRAAFKAIAVGMPAGGRKQDGMKVRVRFKDWHEDERYPDGEIVEVLGRSGTHEVEMHAILAEYDLPYTYPEEVSRAAEKLSSKISTAEIAQRRDFRGVCTFTIDPVTAKDYDDALSFRVVGEDRFEIGVHIADVTHYVQPDDIIDQEAQSRGTSVYLVDRTVPMLPERLCNDLCSLRPNEDKLSYSVLFTMDGKGRVLNTWMGRSVICSERRFTYEEVQQILDGERSEWEMPLRELNRVAQALRHERFAQGAVDFSDTEVRFLLDEKGVPLGVEPVLYTESHQLIEEFMLLANRTVATFVGQARKGDKEYPFVYRVHARPRPEKLEGFLRVIAKLGVPYKGDPARFDGKALGTILHAFEGRAEKHFVDILGVRSMEKAIYSTNNIGHFGLAFEDYTHFTSPIRRYPDMMVHRILTTVLEHGNPTKASVLEEAAWQASEQEKRAADAERASIKYKQVEYLSRFHGKVFSGVISGVTDYGFYVELVDSKCEGLVSVRDIEDDLYLYSADEFLLRGNRTGRVFRLGDPVRVRVKHTDLERRIVDFELV